MTRYSPNSPILGTGNTRPTHVAAFANDASDMVAVMNYLGELNRLCRLVGFNFDLLAAQALHETANFTSPIWRTRLNPVGLGVTDGGDDGIAFTTGTDAARAHVVHMCAYVNNPQRSAFIADWLDDNENIDPRYGIAYRKFQASLSTLSDLTGRWASDPKYAAKIAAKANALLDAAQKGAPMAITAEPCPIETYVQWSGPNRPGLAMHSPSKIVIHEVGNTSPGADEDMHRRFVLAGGGANQVSFHFVVGPTKIVQLLYLDENAWHASDGYFGDGNRDAWGIEHIQIGDFSKTLAHGAWLCSELARNPRRFAIKNPGVFVQDINPENVDERMVQHNWEAPDGKNCPQFIRTRGLWPSYVQAVREAVRVPSKPVKPEPSPIWWEPGDQWGPQKRAHDGALAWAFLGEVTAKRNVPIRKDAHAKADVVHRLKVGDRVQIVGTHKAANKTVWAFIEYAPGKVGRALLSAFDPYRWPTV